MDVNLIDKDKQIPLHYAAESGDFDCVEFLIDNGANINARDVQGKALLHNAITHGNYDIIDLLIELGLILNKRRN